MRSISAAAELKEKVKAELLGSEGRAGVLLGAMEGVTGIVLTFRKAHLGSNAGMRSCISEHSQHSPVRAASHGWD